MSAPLAVKVRSVRRFRRGVCPGLAGHRKDPERPRENGQKNGVYNDLLGFYSDFMGFYSDFMGCYSDI